jgi:AAA+ ATPase superfamily predicted ATPase
MKFVDRISERKRLEKALCANTASFIVIYGRRRCGKSRLIREVLAPTDMYFMADQSAESQQRGLLAKVIGAVISGFDKVLYPDWETLFETLNLRLTGKVTLCLDEFPYMAKSAPSLPSVLQKLLERKEDLRFNLILCGSSQQLMHGLVLDATAPLFGRADEILQIKPMRAAWLHEVLGGSTLETVEEYSVWGGIPRYWELRLAQESLDDALMNHLLSSHGVLYDEPMRLFLDDMRDTTHSFTILSLIASGCHRLSEIAGRLGKPATQLAAPLDKLLRLGYIERETPFGENSKNGKRSLYKIADPFLEFYFRFVVANRSAIEVDRPRRVLRRIKEHFPQYVSRYWEKLCQNAIPYLEIDGSVFNPASRWWGTTAKTGPMELDVVADSPDGKLLVGECKWSDKSFNAEELLAKLTREAPSLPFAKDRKIVPVVFFKHRPDAGSSAHILTPDEVIKVLR